MEKFRILTIQVQLSGFYSWTIRESKLGSYKRLIFGLITKSYIQWGSKYGTSQVFKWQKALWLTNNSDFECHLITGESNIQILDRGVKFCADLWIFCPDFGHHLKTRSKFEWHAKSCDRAFQNWDTKLSRFQMNPDFKCPVFR